MSRRDDDEARLVRYLFHDLPEEERAQVELAFLGDDARFEELEALEDELRHDYLAGTLPLEWRRPFEERFLADADGRRRLESARRTLAALDRGARRPQRSAESFWLAAAATVAIAAGSWALYERQAGRARLDALRAEARSTAAASHQERADALAHELRRERERREALERELAAREEAPPAAPRAVAALVLGPGLVRDGGGRTVALSAEHASLRLSLRLPDGIAAVRLAASLRDAEGAEVWFRDHLTPRVAQVALAVPARVLSAGDYEVVLSVETATGRPEEIADYHFAVVRR